MKRLRLTVHRHLARTAAFEWPKFLRDPRRRRGRRYSFSTLMNALWAGVLTATANLRRLENFTERLGRRISDTTLHRILVNLSPKALRQKLISEVRAAVRAKEVEHDLPFSLCAIDGKAIWTGSYKANRYCQAQEQEGRTVFVTRVLRAVMVSGPCKLQIAQKLIPAARGETSTLPTLLGELHRDYGRSRLLEVFSLDAGFCSKTNVDLISELGYGYVLALKNPQRELVNEAERLLARRKTPDAQTSWEHSKGKRMRRLLFRSTDIAGYHGWQHLREVWRVRQETDKNGQIEVDERYFVTNLSPQRTQGNVPLHTVRAHWGIENDANWTMDTQWLEDDSPWTTAAIEVVSLLRLLAFNVYMRLRARRLRSPSNRTRTWLNLREYVADVLLGDGLAGPRVIVVHTPSALPAL